MFNKKISLIVSVVTYKTSAEDLASMLISLNSALIEAKRIYQLDTKIYIVDNSQNNELKADTFKDVLNECPIEYISNERNVGYGAAQNQIIHTTHADYYLLLNPDILLQEESLLEAFRYMESNSETVALAPEVADQFGVLQYLCKRYPSILDLALRGFAPEFVRRYFKTRLDRYKYSSLIDEKITSYVDLISGCFMFCRGSVLRETGGFNEKYFLYFEDFSLSIELRRYGALVYCPKVKIVHFGGNASKKGFLHIKYFIASAYKFFKIYGWKLI